MQLLQTRKLQNFAQVGNRLSQPFVVGQLNDGFVNGEVGVVVIVDAPGFCVLLEALVPDI